MAAFCTGGAERAARPGKPFSPPHLPLLPRLPLFWVRVLRTVASHTGGRAGETTVRSAHHQGDLEVDKGVGKQVCNPWLKLEPNMATECKYLLLIPPPPEAAGFVPAGILPAYHKPLSRHIHHLMFYPGWRNARQRCRTADGAVRRLVPIPPCGERRSPVLLWRRSVKGKGAGSGRPGGRQGPKPPPSHKPPCSGCVFRAPLVSHTVRAGRRDHGAKRTTPGKPGGK